MMYAIIKQNGRDKAVIPYTNEWDVVGYFQKHSPNPYTTSFKSYGYSYEVADTEKKEDAIKVLTSLNNAHLEPNGFSYYILGTINHKGREWGIYSSALSENIKPIGVLFFRLFDSKRNEIEILTQDIPVDTLNEIITTTIKLHKSHHNL